MNGSEVALGGIVLYLAANLAAGLYLARKVRNMEDFLLAGRNLPLYLVSGTMFATWFGSETIIGVSAEVGVKGWVGAVADPFGAALCLALSGFWMVKRLFPMRLLTFGDLYRDAYGKTAERIASVFLIASYLGWIAAQLVALGVLGELAFGLERSYGTVAGFIVVLVYTFTGGMWSVAVLDFVHNFIIIGALGVIAYFLGKDVDFEETSRRLPADFFRITPSERSVTSALNWLAAWMVIGLGSLPQQDVFQRIMASKDEKTAVYGSYIGAVLYLTVGLLPLLIATYIRAYEPAYLSDPQTSVSLFIWEKMPSWVSFLFVGALVSAVLNCASAAILAPAGILSENLLRPMFPSMSGKAFLMLGRLSVAVIATVSLAMALGRNNIHELVSESSALSLVSLLVPMGAALYLKNHRPAEGIASMTAGMVIWLGALYLKTSIDPLMYGTAGSLSAYLIFRIGRKGMRRYEGKS